MSSKLKEPRSPVVMVGVLPPPVHGQSLATKALFEADLERVEQVVVEIRSSKKLDEVGKASVAKVFGLVGIILRVIKARFSSKADIMYYTAGSAAIVPFVRDVVLLGALRPFFRRTLIHYHSGGLPDYLAKSKWKTVLGRWIYGRGAWSLCLSRHTPVPGVSFGAAREIEIPNGLNVPEAESGEKEFNPEVINILFLGNLYDDKGIFNLIDSVEKASTQTNQRLSLSLVGKFPDEETAQRCGIALEKLQGKVQFDQPAPRYGDDKWRAFSEADIFAFPTFYRSENLPLVVIEAMGMGLPILSTNWRGLPSLVEEGVNGYLCDPHDKGQLTARIVQLADDSVLRSNMAKKSREIYLAKFTFQRHLDVFSSCLDEAVKS